MEESVIAQAWWVPLLGTIVTAILGVIGGFVTNLVVKMTKSMKLNESNKEAIEALLEGMAKAQEELVRGMKKASADGKLTKQEIDSIKEFAWNHAKGAATGPARDIVVQWSSERVGSLIKQLLAKYTTPKK